MTLFPSPPNRKSSRACLFPHHRFTVLSIISCQYTQTWLEPGSPGSCWSRGLLLLPQGEDAGRWELCLAGGCTQDLPSPGSCPATSLTSLTFSLKNKGWKTPGITVAQGRTLQRRGNKGTGDNSHLLSVQLDPCSSSSSKHYPRGTCACPHTTSTQFPAGRTWTVTQFPAGRTRTVQDSTQFPAGRTWTAQTLCKSQLGGLEVCWTLCIYQHQRQWPTSTKANDWEEKGNHLAPKEEGLPASPPTSCCWWLARVSPQKHWL